MWRLAAPASVPWVPCVWTWVFCVSLRCSSSNDSIHPRLLQVLCVSGSPLWTDHGHGPRTTAPEGPNSTDCQLPQHPPSSFCPWSATFATSGNDFLYNFANSVLLWLYRPTQDSWLPLYRGAQTHTPSVSLWEAETQRWQLNPKFVLPANVGVLREPQPRDLEQLQSRRSSVVSVDALLSSVVWGFCCWNACCALLRMSSSNQTIHQRQRKTRLETYNINAQSKING